jgi:hypothetical protein
LNPWRHKSAANGSPKKQSRPKAASNGFNLRPNFGA